MFTRALSQYVGQLIRHRDLHDKGKIVLGRPWHWKKGKMRIPILVRGLSRYWDFHYEDDMVMVPSYLYDGNSFHDDVIKWDHFLCYWPFVRGIHQWLVDSPYKGQLYASLMFSLICTWTNSWANNWDASDLRYHHTHCDVTVMTSEMVSAYWDF